MRFARFVVLTLCVLSALSTAWAGEYRLANGNTLRGEIASADEDGLVVRLDIGGFSPREPWVSFSQETLREFAANPDYAPLVEPFIELTADELQQRAERREIIIREVVTRLERPTPRPTLAGAFLTPIGLFMLVVLMAGNLYAAYEIALFRFRPPILVCGIAFVLPIVGPLIFLALPAYQPAPAPTEPTEELAGSSFSVPTGAERGVGGLSLAAAEKSTAATALTQPQVYQRGEHTFNRRFFETKFPGFFRVVLGEAEKDLVLVIRTTRQEYVCKRISRISTNELHVMPVSSNSETSIPFAEITTAILKHKDAKA
jgi:hypothetical protein